MGSFLFQSDMSHVEGGLFPFNTSTHLPLPTPPPPPNTYKAATNPNSLDYKVPSFPSVPEILEMEGWGDAKTVALSKKKELQQLTMEDEGGRTSKGVYLTWKDLRVTASRGKGGVRVILEGVTCYAWPGEVLAIMRPSGFSHLLHLTSLYK